MDSFQETLEAVQKVLQPYTRPREEAAHIRRILTLHLSSGLKDGATLTEPLSLTESSEVPPYSQDTRGLYREFLEALRANIKARKEYHTLSQKRSHHEVSIPKPTEIQSNYLLNHLTNLKIQKRQEKLLVVKKNLDLLRQKPAASPDFLDHQKLSRVCRPLPEVPTEIINSLALEETSENITASSSVRLEDLVETLEHRTFQTKLSLKQEETLLENAKSHPFAVQPEEINPKAKLQALNATRTELINWVETELGKASGEEKDGGGERARQDDFQVQRDQQLTHKTQLLNQQLASIKEKYAEYLSKRKALLELVTTQLRSLPSLDFPAITAFSSSPSAASHERSSTQAAAAAAAEAPTPAPIIDHLLTPTLTHLLTLSHEHKGLMAHKTHITTLLTKQLRENAQVLDHLVEESQLIPAHATAVVVHKKHDDDPNAMMSSRLVNPWVSAADSAKIATFEVVVEKIEKGQIALEGAIRMLGEADRLLGRGLQQQPQQQQQRQKSVKAACGEEEGNDDDNDGDDDEVGEESDIWLVEGQKSLKITNSTGGSGLGTRYDEGGRKGKETAGHREGGCLSMWNMVDVDVGLEKTG
ncbi:uncharacterized protein B0T23DRAFT_184218 [Neurospora hispaniola]|uniref:Uncharacterized protein n=1 Tax=Neurospora hispaniola TaxID=588809 RepID=A0AAJ0I2X1_9PEZI|nr:hypothetical protein B0T23DRAFT_184218 [Neurospora hispaniola]